MFEVYPVGNPTVLAHIWILHKILDRIAPILSGFKRICLKSKYPNRVAQIENANSSIPTVTVLYTFAKSDFKSQINSKSTDILLIPQIDRTDFIPISKTCNFEQEHIILSIW